MSTLPAQACSFEQLASEEMGIGPALKQTEQNKCQKRHTIGSFPAPEKP